jgi:hypothetical protein
MCETQLGPPQADREQATARPTIGQIFRQYGRAYRAKHGKRMSPEQRRVTCPDCGAEMTYMGFVPVPQGRFASTDTS